MVLSIIYYFVEFSIQIPTVDIVIQGILTQTVVVVPIVGQLIYVL